MNTKNETEPVRELYHAIKIPDGMQIAPCPCCGAAPELWEYTAEAGGACTKVVMCSTSEGIGPQEHIVNEGCPMYMPNNEFYRPTQREAVAYWNFFARALVGLRVDNAAASAVVWESPEAGTAGRAFVGESDPHALEAFLKGVEWLATRGGA